ncbi:hypothetical protein D3Z51_08070 [Clostridiaceae bacterium]|nr:hypothetical protein [Clostridiaceae bacterium]RKI14771.1 hypothetical protein D7V81_08065 [bacterium 1XD21-70]
MGRIWYLLDCCGEEEQEVVGQCMDNAPRDILEAAWILKCQKLLRYQGGWHVAERNLFPGYVVLSVPDKPEGIAPLEEMLKRLFPGSRRERNGRLHAVCQGSRESLLRLCGGSQVIGMSRGRICGENLVVTGGPLAGHEKNIRKIDRHKRVAWVGMPGEAVGEDRRKEPAVLQRICVGLEIYEKHIQD